MDSAYKLHIKNVSRSAHSNCSDPLPWQCLSRYPIASEGCKFIDIDYKDLMLKKRAVVLDTHELNLMFTNIEQDQSGEILLRSDQYVQIGCDLRELRSLHEALSSVVDIPNSKILFVAEVSITYSKDQISWPRRLSKNDPTDSMISVVHVQASDALIEWVATLPEGNKIVLFCSLETNFL